MKKFLILGLIIGLLLPSMSFAAVGVTHLTGGSRGNPVTLVTTSSTAPAQNSLVLVITGSTASDGVNYVPAVSGLGMTWVNVSKAMVWISPGITIWRAMNTTSTPSAGAITIDWTGLTQSRAGWLVEEFTGVDTSGTNGSGAIVQHASTTVSASNGTTTLSAFADASNATFGAWAAGGTTTNITPGSGMTEIAEVVIGNPAAGYELASEWQNSNNTTPGASWDGATDYQNGFGAEIAQAAASAAAVSRQRLIAIFDD